jgi:hypothetical protein
MIEKCPSMTTKIIETVPHGSVIIELGSGKSTAQLTEYFEVWAIEETPKYVGLSDDVNYVYAPLTPVDRTPKKFPALTEWYDLDVLRNEMPKKHAAIIVDGPCLAQYRGGFYHNYSLFDPTAIVFIDDVGRWNEINMLRWFTRDLKIPRVTIEDSHQRHMWSMFDPKDSVR